MVTLRASTLLAIAGLSLVLGCAAQPIAIHCNSPQRVGSST
jgi:hypothetical protein